jgi:superfamily II DNA or RNA helicase/predicted house-cleaning noncanonical NTP pyrophosphatase (MazG superfamily)
MDTSQEGFVSPVPLIQEKLVRDRIPDLVAGETSRKADSAELPALLAAKVVEEAAELADLLRHPPPNSSKDGILLELADLYDVLDKIIQVHGITPRSLAEAREEKRRRRGGFDQNRVLGLPAPVRRLSSGPDVPFRATLVSEIESCRKASFAVAFIGPGGIETLLPSLREALGRGATFRILTTDYLGVTDPGAVQRLLDLREDYSPESLEIRFHRWDPVQGLSRGFHPKTYLFERRDGRKVAYAGSSNLSMAALSRNIEWNVVLGSLDLADPVAQLEEEFERAYRRPEVVAATRSFLQEYARRRRPAPSLQEGSESETPIPEPRSHQQAALAELVRLRGEGRGRALAIMATGLGKTYLAVFDSLGFGRVLFLAHRREILEQAREAFRTVRPLDSGSFFGGGERDLSGTLVFAQVQSLGRKHALDAISKDHFDYIVVDECHHAEAPTYRRILDHFTPRFVLGLSATPYRMDNGDIFALMEDSVACRMGFMEGIRQNLLAPFSYRGLKDPVDYSRIPWRQGRLDPVSLEAAVMRDQRTAEVLRVFREMPGRRTVAFCVSVAHARSLLQAFREQGIAGASVDGGTPPAERRRVLDAFRRGEVSLLFVVDLLNEGVDIPEIDRVLLLRPTESPTVFLQQIGRGLRKAPGKERLTICDFVGNHRRAHYVLPALFDRIPESGEWTQAAREALVAYETKRLDLPESVSITFDWEVVDLLKARIFSAEPREERLLSDYLDLWERLEHRPTLLETQIHGDRPVRDYLSFFGDWHSLHRALEKKGKRMDPEEAQLFETAGAFLRALERTSLTFSFKLAVLSIVLRENGFDRPLPISRLVAGFRDFYKNPRYRPDLEKAALSDLDHVTDRTLETYLLKNPVKAWTGSGAGEGGPFFSWDKGSGFFSYIGPKTGGPLFAEAVRERLEYRLADYFGRRVKEGGDDT